MHEINRSCIVSHSLFYFLPLLLKEKQLSYTLVKHYFPVLLKDWQLLYTLGKIFLPFFTQRETSIAYSGNTFLPFIAQRETAQLLYILAKHFPPLIDCLNIRLSPFITQRKTLIWHWVCHISLEYFISILDCHSGSFKNHFPSSCTLFRTGTLSTVRKIMFLISSSA